LGGLLWTEHATRCLQILQHYCWGSTNLQIYSECYKAIKALKKSHQGVTKYLADKSHLIEEAMTLQDSIPLQVEIIWIKNQNSGPERRTPQDLNDITHTQANSFL
jgi:hypothetical protein